MFGLGVEEGRKAGRRGGDRLIWLGFDWMFDLVMLLSGLIVVT